MEGEGSFLSGFVFLRNAVLIRLKSEWLLGCGNNIPDTYLYFAATHSPYNENMQAKSFKI